MANSARGTVAEELIYQGPLIGMKETKPKEQPGMPKKPVAGEKPSGPLAQKR